MLKQLQPVFNLLDELAKLVGAVVIKQDYIELNPVRVITPINQFELAVVQLNVANLLCAIRMLRGRTYQDFELNAAGISDDLRRLISRSINEIYPGAPRNLVQMKENIAAYGADYDEVMDQAEQQYTRSLQVTGVNQHYVQNWLVLIKLSTIIYQRLSSIPIDVDTSDWLNLILAEFLYDWDFMQCGVLFNEPTTEEVRNVLLNPNERETFPDYIRPASMMHTFCHVAAQVVFQMAVPLIISKMGYAQAFAARERLRKDNKIISGGAVTNKFFYNIHNGIADTGRPALKSLLKSVVEIRREIFANYSNLLNQIINYGFTLISDLSAEYGNKNYVERIQALDMKLSHYKITTGTVASPDQYVYSVWGDLLFNHTSGILAPYIEEEDWRKLTTLNDDDLGAIITQFENRLVPYAQLHADVVKNIATISSIEDVTLLPTTNITFINSLEMPEQTDFKNPIEFKEAAYITDRLAVSVYSAHSIFMDWINEIGTMKNLVVRNMTLSNRSSMVFWRVARVGNLLEQPPQRIDAVHIERTDYTTTHMDPDGIYDNPNASVALRSSATVVPTYELVPCPSLYQLLDDWFDKLTDYADYDSVKKRDAYMDEIKASNLSVASEDVQVNIKQIVFEALEIATAIELYKTDLMTPGTDRIFALPLGRLSGSMLNYRIVKANTLEKLVPLVITGDVEMPVEIASVNLPTINVGDYNIPVRVTLVKPNVALRLIDQLNTKPDMEFGAYVPTLAELIELSGTSEVHFSDLQPIELSVGIVKNEALYYPGAIYGPVAHRLSFIDFPVFSDSVEQLRMQFTSGASIIHDWTGKVRRDRHVLRFCLHLLQLHLDAIDSGNKMPVNIPIISDLTTTRSKQLDMRADELIQEVIYRLLEHAVKIAGSQFGTLVPISQFVSNINITGSKVYIDGTEFEAVRSFQAAIFLLLCQAYGELNVLTALNQRSSENGAKTAFARWNYLYESLVLPRRVSAVPDWCQDFVNTRAVTNINTLLNSLDNEFLMRLLRFKRTRAINIHGPNKLKSIRSLSEY